MAYQNSDIVLEHPNFGCLIDYLKANPLDWEKRSISIIEVYGPKHELCYLISRLDFHPKFWKEKFERKGCIFSQVPGISRAFNLWIDGCGYYITDCITPCSMPETSLQEPQVIDGNSKQIVVGNLTCFEYTVIFERTDNPNELCAKLIGCDCVITSRIVLADLDTLTPENALSIANQLWHTSVFSRTNPFE